MVSDIALTSSQRSNLLSLQNTATLSSRTQVRLATGKEINEVTDGALKFFQGKALSDRATDFDAFKDVIDQAISALRTSLHALDSVEDILNQLDGLALASASQITTERAQTTITFTRLGAQIDLLAGDASYQGRNLVNQTLQNLNVKTGENSEYEVVATDVTTTRITNVFGIAGAFDGTGALVFSNIAGAGLQGAGTAAASFTRLGDANSNTAALDVLRDNIDTAITQVRTRSAALGASVAFLQIRLDFNNLYVNELSGGSDKLTLADLNEEGANLVALQTRQQLGIQSLAISGQQQQAIIQLLQ